MNRLVKWFQKTGREHDGFKNLDEEERGMVRGIVELSDTSAKEVMIPRIDTVFIPVETGTGRELIKLMETGHSRFPVYRDTIDNVIGILYVKDLLIDLLKGEEVKISEVVRKAYFVPERMKLDRLLREMKQRRIHLAITVDEYGGVSGIISLENILEEIVGDIQDEFDNEGEDILKLGDNEWLCDARISLVNLKQESGFAMPTDDFDTLGGFVFDLFGKIPTRYEKAVWNGLTFVIQSLEGHKIQQVKITKVNDENDG